MKGLRLAFWGAIWALSLPQFSFASDSTVVFGLTNVVIGEAILMRDGVTNLNPNGTAGLSILLGEADSGVFAYPDTSDNPSDGDYMLGKAYGTLNGVPDQLLCTVRGRKVSPGGGFGVYPITVDFSALGVTNFLAQVFGRLGDLVTQREIGLEEPILRTDFNGYHISRVNPFWRAPDGTINVVIEFPASTGFELPNSPPGTYIPFGQRLVLRALNPTGVVDFVSRVDVTTGAQPTSDDQCGITSFRMNEVRLGVFGRPHKAIGDVALQARAGALKVARLNTPEPDPGNDFMEAPGVHVELDRAQNAAVDFEPVGLSGANAQFGITALVRPTGSFGYFTMYSYVLGSLRLQQTTNAITLSGIFEHLGTNAQQVRMEIYRSGELVGQTPVLELENNVFPLVTIFGNPRLVRAGAQGNTLEAPPGIDLTFDASATFTLTNGSEVISLQGDKVKFLSVGPIYVESPITEQWIESVDAILINSRALAEFTITAEQERRITPPQITFTRADSQIRLSWPDPNRSYYVQAGSELLGRYNESAPWPDNSQATAVAFDTISPTNTARFYRLVHAGYGY